MQISDDRLKALERAVLKSTGEPISSIELGYILTELIQSRKRLSDLAANNLARAQTPRVIKMGAESMLGAVYIGRNRNGIGNHFGNPFSHLRISKATVIVATREEAIESFRKWISGEAFTDVEPKRRQWILDNIHKLKGRDLMCFCAPLPCHGDVLLRYANSL